MVLKSDNIVTHSDTMELESSAMRTGRMKCESQLQKLLAELLETEKKYVQDLQQVSQGQDLV